MKLKVQLVVCADDGREEPVQEVATLEKDCQRIEHLGLRLAEAKQLLAMLQQHLVEQQAATFVAGFVNLLTLLPDPGHNHLGDDLSIPKRTPG